MRVWRTPGLQDKRVEKIFVHPKYVPHNFSNDVAVLKLTEPAHLTNFVRPICLWEGPSQLELIVKKVGKCRVLDNPKKKWFILKQLQELWLAGVLTKRVKLLSS